MRRSEQIGQAIQNFLTTHKEWQNSNRSEYPDEIYTGNVEALDAVFKSGDIPDDCQHIVAPLLAFLDQYNGYWETSAQRPDPPYDLWVKLEELERMVRPQAQPEPHPIETIAELNEQKVGHAQIAMMWNLVTPQGGPNVAYVLMELRKPGCIVDEGKYPDGRTWVSREEQKRRARGELAQAASAKLAAAPVPKPKKKDRQPCPETAEELYLQGVGIEQAAAMLCLSVGDATDLWKQFEAEAQAVADESKPKPHRRKAKAVQAE